MRRSHKKNIAACVALLTFAFAASECITSVRAADAAVVNNEQSTQSSSRPAPEVTVASLNVTGNSQIDSEYILGVVETKVGSKLTKENLQKDIEAIYEQGFFSFVDVDLHPASKGNVDVTFTVRENPIIESITFEGNTIYSSEALMKEVFSQEGTVFNRVFFRNDLDRIQERYHTDGYVMVRVSDVQVQGGNIHVVILEPRVGDVIIQGNRRTKTNVIRREIKLKEGDIFNVTHFRYQLGKLQGLGYFEDVGVAFDNSDPNDDSKVDLILTVKEKRTASIGVNLAYGTESGLSGGLTYGDTNLAGKGYNFEVGFDEGDEASYWLTFASPYMDYETFAWRVGVRYWTYDDRYYYRQGHRQFDFDEKSLNIYAGLGKKFKNEDWSWFLTLRHQDTSYSDVHNVTPGYVDDLTKWEGVNQTVELQLTYDKRDPYTSYSKGYIWDTTLEQAFEGLGGDFSYLKYWTQFRYYLPVSQLIDGLFDVQGGWSDEDPILFAARLRIGSATKDNLPAFARYSLGGMNTLRGYNSRSFEGSNYVLGNFELRVPIQSNFSLVGFYDIGNANDSFDWGNMHDNYGLGLRIKTPFGNLRLDYAHGEEENKTYFGFGEMF